MPIFAKRVGIENLNKYYLEQALLVYSIEKPLGYLQKIQKINEILNDTVKKEMKYGEYQKKVSISKKTYLSIFG